MFVDRRPAEPGEIQPLAAGDHCRTPPGEFGGFHTPPHDSHQIGGHLLVRHGTAGVGVDEPVDGVSG
jgi:hypothetical protein